MTGTVGPRPADGETTVDAFLGGRFRLHQPRRGFRSGSDALFLAATVPADASGLVVDLGAGPGAVGFAAATAAPAARVALVEVSEAARALLARSLADPANRSIADRLQVVAGDVADRPILWSPPLANGSASHVLANPPWFPEDRHNPPPQETRRLARTLPGSGLAPWVATARRMLAPRGRLALVLPSEALPELLADLSRGFGSIVIHPLFPRPGRPATRAIVTAERGGRAPLVLSPGLLVHGDGPGYTSAAEVILREGARFPGAASAGPADRSGPQGSLAS